MQILRWNLETIRYYFYTNVLSKLIGCMVFQKNRLQIFNASYIGIVTYGYLKGIIV